MGNEKEGNLGVIKYINKILYSDKSPLYAIIIGMVGNITVYFLTKDKTTQIPFYIYTAFTLLVIAYIGLFILHKEYAYSLDVHKKKYNELESYSNRDITTLETLLNEKNKTINQLNIEKKSLESDIHYGIAPLIRKGGFLSKYANLESWQTIFKAFCSNEDEIHAIQMYSWSRKAINSDCIAYDLKYETGYVSKLTEQNAIIQSRFKLSRVLEDDVNNFLEINHELQIAIEESKHSRRTKHEKKSFNETKQKSIFQRLSDIYKSMNSEFIDHLKELKEKDITVGDAIKLQILNLTTSIHDKYTYDDDDSNFQEFAFDNKQDQRRFKKIKPHINRMKRTAILNCMLTNKIIPFILNNKGAKYGRLYVFIPFEHHTLDEKTIIQLTIPSKSEIDHYDANFDGYAQYIEGSLRKFVQNRLDG